MALYNHRFGGHTAAGEIWMFTWWAESARSTADAHVAAQAWINALWAGPGGTDGLGSHVAPAVGHDQVTTVLIDPATGTQQARMDAAVSLDGTSAANTLPADVAIVCSLRTATPTRSGRGRFYLPPLTVTDVAADGRVVAATVVDLTQALQFAWTGYNSAADRPVVYSRTQRVTRSITSFDMGDLFDTQRGREDNLVEARTSLSMP